MAKNVASGARLVRPARDSLDDGSLSVDGETSLAPLAVNDSPDTPISAPLAITVQTTTVIESAGSTSLVQVNSNYTLGNSGPVLKFSGAAVTAGQFGTWTPIGVEKTPDGSGYLIVWRNGSADQYTVWSADGSGNYLSSVTGVVTGASSALTSLEPYFSQDLNGIGGITPSTVVEAAGSTRLKRVAGVYFFAPLASTQGPELNLAGAAVTLGQFGNWTPLGVEKSADGSGYLVPWRNGSADQYTVWYTNNNGSYITSVTGVVSGSNSALASLEPYFSQDLNGSGAITSSTVLDALGSTRLVRVSNSYFLLPPSGTQGPELNAAGAVVTAGQYGTWAPIGVEHVGAGYQVAWKDSATNLFTIWNTDANGTYLSNAIGAVAGTTSLLQSFESVFQQDLNGVGGITPATVIEAAGSTKLVQVAGNYFLNPVSGGLGPQLTMSGALVSAGQFGAWNPIGAEQFGNGYWVAWKNGGFDQYTVWETSASGNYLRSLIGTASAATSTLQQFEPAFHQDLNGDGVIPIEAVGATKLTQVSNTYSLYSMGSVSGPQLRFNGAAVTVGQFGAYTPIGADATPTGYRVAWYGGGDQYTVWNTDSSGNYVSNVIGTVSGSSAALQSLEPSLQQDLNRDGVIPTVATIKSFGATSLITTGNAYLLGNIYGPQLKLGGTVVDARQMGPWTAIGAEQISGGYEVAWRAGSADLYMVWNTDSNGNYLSSPVNGVPGGSTALEALEPSFQQDLNRDGIVGIPGIHINLIYDAFALAAPQSFRDGMQAAVNILQAAFLDPITVNIAVGYGEFGGTALENLVPFNQRNQAQNISLGNIGYTGGGQFGNGQGVTVSYSTLRGLLASDAKDSTDSTSVNSLPGGTSLEGHSSSSWAVLRQRRWGPWPPTTAPSTARSAWEGISPATCSLPALFTKSPTPWVASTDLPWISSATTRISR